MHVFKQYGLQRSGTNIIKALIEINLEDTFVCSNMFGGKHQLYEPVPEEYNPLDYPGLRAEISPTFAKILARKFKDDDVIYLLSIKNIFSWVVSFRKYIHKHGLQDKYDLTLETLVKHWNISNLNWIDNLSSRKFMIIEHDKLVFNKENVIQEIANKFCIKRKSGIFNPINNTMAEGFDIHGSKNILKKEVFNEHNYYRNHEYMSEFTPEEVLYVKNNFDKRLSDFAL